MGLTGSETVRRATYIFVDAANTWNAGSCSLVYRGAASGAGQHTILMEWKSDGSNTISINPSGDADFEHASLLVQEVSA